MLAAGWGTGGPIGLSAHETGREERAVVESAAQRSGVVPGEAVLLYGAAAEPAPDAAKVDGLCVVFDDQYGAG